MLSLFLLIIKISLVIAAIVLSIYWIKNPQLPIEPWIIMVTTLAGTIEIAWRKRLPSKTYFPDINKGFYNYYAKQTDKAKKEVWVTTDGYNMKNPTSYKYSR